MKRPLTTGELTILHLIQRLYGNQNTTDRVFFSAADDAVIFVKDTEGTLGLCVVLTNVARGRLRVSAPKKCPAARVNVKGGISV